ncbi:hypothetical protein [Anaerotignum propionicum]|uniref:hypothetical protein n=1 Tax=Anaerotignum propionicum TaxID=28446 RepID=UPI0028A14514|nr:hypothetical protein [Anaerotignum propionicum]
MTIDRDIIRGLLRTTSSKNLVGIGMELKPYELALHMLQALNNTEEYGYVVMGVRKLIDCYMVEGVSPTIIQGIVEPIKTALNLMSSEFKVQFANISIDGKNIFVIMMENIKKSISLEFLKDFDSQEAFVKNLVRACLNLQARKHYSNASEDERNDYIGDILGAVGYNVKDQTRRGSSSTGKGAGEVDIYISRDGLPFTVVEAMNLNSVDTSYINTHLDKLFTYDGAGNKFNICLSYVKLADFDSFWKKYSDYVSNYCYPAPILSTDLSIDDDYGYSELRIMKTNHNRSGKEVKLYHICVNIH